MQVPETESAKFLPPTVIAGRQDSTLKKPSRHQNQGSSKAQCRFTHARLAKTRKLKPCQHLWCISMTSTSQPPQQPYVRSTCTPLQTSAVDREPTNRTTRLRAARLLMKKQQAGKKLTGKVQHKWKPLKGLINLSAVPVCWKVQRDTMSRVPSYWVCWTLCSTTHCALETPTLDPGNPNPLAYSTHPPVRFAGTPCPCWQPQTNTARAVTRATQVAQRHGAMCRHKQYTMNTLPMRIAEVGNTAQPVIRSTQVTQRPVT